jgi:hypothetical protein
MLREVEGGNGQAGRLRRAFTDTTLHLYFWTEPDGSIFGFQLLYWQPDRSRRSLMWTRQEGYLHHAVSHVEGGSNRWDPGADMEPLRADEFDKAAMLERLKPAVAGLEPGLALFLLDAVRSHPEPAR